MKVVCTPQFIKEFEGFCKSRPLLRDKMREFLEFRLLHPNGEPFNSKDSMFTGATLKGYRHIHLWQGKGIVVYRATPSEIILFTMASHDDASENPEILKRFLEKDHDFIPFSLEVAEEELSKEDHEKIEAELYDLASSDDSVLKDGGRGDFEDLMAWLGGVVGLPNEPETDRLIASGFGGLGKFQEFIKTIRRSYGLKEGSMRRWIRLAESLASRRTML